MSGDSGFLLMGVGKPPSQEVLETASVKRRGEELVSALVAPGIVDDHFAAELTQIEIRIVDIHGCCDLLELHDRQPLISNELVFR